MKRFLLLILLIQFADGKCGKATIEPPCQNVTFTKTGVFDGCPKTWERNGKDCYKTFAGYHTFYEAKELCEAENDEYLGMRISSQLAVVTTPEVNNLIYSGGTSEKDEVWIGLMSSESTTYPQFIDGTFVNFTKWIVNRPSNRWEEPTCVSIWIWARVPENLTQLPFWEAMPCTDTKSAYVCQMVQVEGPVCHPPVKPKCTFKPSAGSACPEGWTLYEEAGTCYKPLVLPNAAYDDFVEACNEEEAFLPSMHSDQQYHFLREQIGADIPFWVGLKSVDGGRNDNFDRFDDGTPINYGKWRYAYFDSTGPDTANCGVADVNFPNHSNKFTNEPGRVDQRPDDTPTEGWTMTECTSTTTASHTLCAKRAVGTFEPAGCESLISPNPRAHGP